MKTYLVTGIGGPAGRNVAELLLERGQQVVGTDMRAVTLPGVEFHQVPPAGAKDFLDAILSIARREKVDCVIPTVSEELPVLAGAGRWPGELPLLVSPREGILTADDKYLTARKLAGGGVNVPRFALPSQVHSARELAEKIGWPCISKPRVGRGGRGVSLHLKEDWPAISGLNDHFILQEFADGTDYAPNVSLDRDGKALVVVLEKTELKDGIVGNAKSVKRVDAPDVCDLAAQAARIAGLFGPLDIDIRRRADGVPVVLEINARFGANIRQAPEVLEAALDLLQVLP
ncbi:MAG TPA: ATP-grasp domain-containing protein [Anaerolineales bacterium]|nr:ATP-grasp domain-containing protein [Anaerolineales bacterium]